MAMDMRKMTADPITRKWWALTDPCEEPFETRDEGEWWATMNEIFHHELSRPIHTRRGGVAGGIAVLPSVSGR
jgi:hypothetical protein